ncbi:hypothetical protein MMC13_007312 [Lambiella insularis]|nr:hypothetical protein [Lambiella insularis]
MLGPMESPYKRAGDSPSRQLLWELGRLHIDGREAFQAKLEKESLERESAHRAALAAAAEEHDRIRRSAEREREKLQLQIQAERARRDQEERKELDRQRQERIDEQIANKQKEVQRLAAKEAADKKIAELQRLEAEAVERRRIEKERQDADAARRVAEQETAERESQEREKRARDAAAAAISRAQIKPKPAPTPVPDAAPTVQIARGNPSIEAEHQRYLEIHRKLKEFRKYMLEQGKRNPALKKQMGDMRRTIKKCVGQLTGGKAANQAPKKEITETLKIAAGVAHPQVDITMFLSKPPSGIADTNGPALLVYQLNIFAKALISQFVNEASVAPKSADPVGVIGSAIFAQNDFRWNGLSLIDILIAKYHVVCPILFGIYGNDTTDAGKRRSGWTREDKTGPWVSEQRHFDRMTGLGAGFAAISLRNYDKAKAHNPYPIHNFWRSLAAIVNVPPTKVSSTHFIVLKAMIENNESRILDFFGDAGRLALRKALITFPQQSGATSVAAKALSILPDALQRERKLFL